MSWGNVDWSESAVPSWDHFKIILIAAAERHLLKRISYPFEINRIDDVPFSPANAACRAILWDIVDALLYNIDCDTNYLTPSFLRVDNVTFENYVTCAYDIDAHLLEKENEKATPHGISIIRSRHNLSPLFAIGSMVDTQEVMRWLNRIRAYLDEFNVLAVDISGDLHKNHQYFEIHDSNSTNHGITYLEFEDFSKLFEAWKNKEMEFYETFYGSYAKGTVGVEDTNIGPSIGYSINCGNEVYIRDAYGPGKHQSITQKYEVIWSNPQTFFYPFTIKSHVSFWADITSNEAEFTNLYNILPGWNRITSPLGPGDTYKLGEISSEHISDGVLMSGQENHKTEEFSVNTIVSINRLKFDFRCEGGFQYYSDPENTLEQN